MSVRSAGGTSDQGGRRREKEGGRLSNAERGGKTKRGGEGCVFVRAGGGIKADKQDCFLQKHALCQQVFISKEAGEKTPTR